MEIIYNTRSKKRRLTNENILLNNGDNNSGDSTPKSKQGLSDDSEQEDEHDSQDSDYVYESEETSDESYDDDDDGEEDLDMNDLHIDSSSSEENQDFINLITKKLIYEANKISEEKEKEKENNDEHDKEYLKHCENLESKDNSEDLYENDFSYFKKLSKDLKIKYLGQLTKIKTINGTQIPFKFKVLNSGMDDDTRALTMYNINKLNQLDNSMGEYSKMKHWIDGILKIPFNTYINLTTNIDSSIQEKKDFLKQAYSKLNEAIYGHDKAKSYILQVMCKWIQNPDSCGNILALQGPMGNGKTTLIKEGVAKAINRPFAFISLGGSSDSSYFNGHAYTYEGSTWGRIIDILIETKCMNPIIYFDELDKVSETSKGDEIIHFLTHITDLSQNSIYKDNYFPGVNIDLSKILFIFSFNDEHKIDKILKDRMQVIHTTGFKLEEKIEIANNYLIPEIYNNYKFTKDNVIIETDILKIIINDYTKNEEGVRNLKRCLDMIVSKINMYYILYDEDKKSCYIDLSYKLEDFKLPYTLTEKDLKELLDSGLPETDKPPNYMYL